LSWKRCFDDPIVPPDGGQIVTLEDAGNYITMLPKADQQLGEWQTAIECLMLVVKLRRANDVCAHWYHEGVEPPCRTRVRPVAEGQALGTPEVGARSMTNAAIIAASIPTGFALLPQAVVC
jgi:hypothetical protein